MTNTELQLIAKVAELEEQLSVQAQNTRISNLEYEEKKLLKEIKNLRDTYNNLTKLVSDARDELDKLGRLAQYKNIDVLDTFKDILIDYIKDYEY